MYILTDVRNKQRDYCIEGGTDSQKIQVYTRKDNRQKDNKILDMDLVKFKIYCKDGVLLSTVYKAVFAGEKLI